MEQNPFLEKAPKPKRSPLLGILQTLVVATSVFIILYLFVITPNQVDGPSMEPNFQNDQIMFTSKITQWLGDTSIGKSLDLDYKRGDVIVFQLPGSDEAIVKRVIGLPGDRVSIREGYVYINGQKLVESYLPPATFTRGVSFIQDGGEAVEVKDDTFVVLGDNRAVSRDSRAVGLISRDWLKGKVIFRFWPVDSLSIISTGKWSLEN